MDYDQNIDETIRLVEAEKARLLSMMRDGGGPELPAQISAIYAYEAAISYQRQRQVDLDRAQEQLAEAADRAREAHKAYRAS